ncbi:class I SAM-dependent methyltransferase, partial [Pseudomonas aeruginosa]|uniref:class I SAM-dependent methyltransferase n=3 Tax=Pseudomonas aeruginosa TaxID=287 RepID=UPI001E61CD55
AGASALPARSARPAAGRVMRRRPHSRQPSQNPIRCGHDPAGLRSALCRVSVRNGYALSRCVAPRCRKPTHEPPICARSVPKAALARPLPTRQTRQKGRLNFLYPIAKKRAQAAGFDLSFIQANMLDLSAVGTFDYVTCYSDSICYMQDEVEVGDVFKEVYDHLKEDGVFIFDVHSTHQVDEVFPGYSHHENAEDFAMVWDSYADEAPHSVVHELTFFIQEEDGRFSRFDEVHEERTYDILTYDILLEQAGFTSFKVYADFEDEGPGDTSRRWFFVCRK